MSRIATATALAALLLAAAQPSFGQNLGLAAAQGPGPPQPAGTRLTFVCPAGDGRASVYGTDVYTAESGVCAAAIHAGVLALGQAGAVTIVFGSGAEQFRGSERNGVVTRSYGRWPQSYTFARDGAPGRISWRTQWNQVPMEFAGPLRLECPPGGDVEGAVWGTDTYTRASVICVAAVHAGAITPERGGVIEVRRARNPGEFAASERNGVKSQPYGPYQDAFAIAAASRTLVASPARTLDPAGTATPVAVATAAAGARSRETAVAAAGGAPTLATTAAPAATEPASAGREATGTQSAAGVVLGAPATTSITPVCTLAAPVIRKSLGTPGAAYLVWNAVAGATGYTIARTDLGALTPQPLTATEFKHSAPLEHETIYHYVVTALHPQGCGEVTVDVQPQAAATPTIRRVLATGGDLATRKGRVTIEWRLSHSDATGYLVFGPGVPNGVEVAARGDAVHRVEIGGLAPGNHTWTVAPVWDTPLGRAVDAGRGAKATATVGFYRAQINAFQAEHETFDNQTSADGRYDEIYIGSAAYVNSTLARIAISAIHGDIGAPPIPLPGAPSRAGRIQAGTGSATGGIRTGDIVPYSTNPSYNPAGPNQPAYRDRFPMIAWEGWLGGDSAVELSPSIWESDGDLTAFNEWQTLMIGQCEGGERLGELLDEDSGWGGSDTKKFQEELRQYQQEKQLLQSATSSQLEAMIMQLQSDDREAPRDERLRDIERRDAIDAQADLKVENACPDAKAGGLPDLLLPLTILTGPGKDRYIGSISRTPLVRFSTAAPVNGQTLVFADVEVGAPLLGVYRIWITFFPI
jgi:hypothetical protein